MTPINEFKCSQCSKQNSSWWTLRLQQSRRIVASNYSLPANGSLTPFFYNVLPVRRVTVQLSRYHCWRTKNIKLQGGWAWKMAREMSTMTQVKGISLVKREQWNDRCGSDSGYQIRDKNFITRRYESALPRKINNRHACTLAKGYRCCKNTIQDIR